MRPPPIHASKYIRDGALAHLRDSGAPLFTPDFRPQAPESRVIHRNRAERARRLTGQIRALYLPQMVLIAKLRKIGKNASHDSNT